MRCVARPCLRGGISGTLKCAVILLTLTLAACGGGGGGGGGGNGGGSGDSGGSGGSGTNAPNATADSMTVFENASAVVIPVLDNDSFGDDGPGTAAISIAASATNGAVAVDDNGTPDDPTDDSLTYTPAIGYHGPDTFDYRIVDADGDAAEATVTITVEAVGNSPIAHADSADVDENAGPTPIEVLANDTFGTDGAGETALTITSQASNGTATVDDNGTPIDPTDDRIRYMPDADYIGEDTFTYRIEDVDGDQASATVTVSVVDAQAQAWSLQLFGSSVETQSPSIVSAGFRVYDRRTGESVTNLVLPDDDPATEDDITALENAQALSPAESFLEVAPLDEGTIDTVLVVDISQSVGSDIQLVRDGLRSFIQDGDGESRLRSNQRVAIFTFDDTVTQITGFTADLNTLNNAIDSITLGGPSTNLYGAIIDAANSWSNVFQFENVRYGSMIVISDGADTAASYTAAQAQTAVADKEVFAIRVGELDEDQEALEDIAGRGEVFNPADFNEFSNAIDDAQAVLQRFIDGIYFLSYASPKRSGTHQLTVNLEDELTCSTLVGDEVDVDEDGIADGCYDGYTQTFNANGFSSVVPELVVTGETTFEQSGTLTADTRWSNAGTYTWSVNDPGAVDMHVSNDTTRMTLSLPQVSEDVTTQVTVNDTDNGLSQTLTVQIIDIDSDDDGTPDSEDAFPNDPDEDTDTDGDGVGDNADAFPEDPDETTDTDGDGIGDNSDPDIDGDGVDNEEDAFPYDPDETTDTDGDGIGDNSDPDIDGDGVDNDEDAFPYDPTETKDTDGDGIGDNSDPDSDQPTAANDSAVANPGTPLVLDVLSNDDFGLDGAGTLEIVTNAGNGDVTLDDRGTPSDATDDRLVYQADADYVGSDTFSYRITDVNGDEATASVTLDVQVGIASFSAGATGEPKTIRFDWSVQGHTAVDHYTLSVNPDGSSGYSPVAGAETLSGTSFDMEVPVHLTDWANATYRLEARDSGGTVLDSDDLGLLTEMASADAIGYFKASNPGTDGFGNRIALSADGTRMAVGSPMEDSSATGINGDPFNDNAQDSGAVYVFAKTATGWTQEAFLKASNAEAGDRFGSDVALSDDGTRLAVGASLEDSTTKTINGDSTDNSGTDVGAVYVFDHDGSSWNQTTYVKPSESAFGMNFGTQVDLSDDGTVLVAGTSVINGVFLFTHDGTAWSEQASVLSDNWEYGDGFGHSLALSGDGTRLVVGAANEESAATGINGDGTDNSVSQSGAAYVFAYDGTAWSQEAYIKADVSNTNMNFGRSVDLSDDGTRLAVGTHSADVQRVETFANPGSGWTQASVVELAASDPNDQYGTPMALSGDGNYLIIGAPLEDGVTSGIGGASYDNSLTNAGAAYFIELSPAGALDQVVYMKASNPEADDNFGGGTYGGVAISDDGSTVAVGAAGEDSGATGVGGDQTDNSVNSAGALYLY